MELGDITLTKNGKRKWSIEQKMNIVNELNSGLPMSEICRKYNIQPQMLSKVEKEL